MDIYLIGAISVIFFVLSICCIFFWLKGNNKSKPKEDASDIYPLW